MGMCRSFFAAMTLAVVIVYSGSALAFQLNDGTGDTPGPDLSAMTYDISDDHLDVKLSLSQALCTDVINPNLLATVRLDLDQSQATGFVGGGGLHPRFGVDYEIEIPLDGFCSGDSAALKYWHHKRESPEIVSRERVSIPVGNPFYSNGSVFVVGANSSFGTTARDVFVRIPLALFSNAAFPVCSNAVSLCATDLFSCPPVRAFDLKRAFVSVVVVPFIVSQAGIDTLPDDGAIATNTLSALENTPRMLPTELRRCPIPTTISSAPPGLNGEEITNVAAYRHEYGNHTFEIKLRVSGMSRSVLKFARQASLVDQARRPWLAVQGWG